MDTTIKQQVAMDEALVPYARRLRIGRSNFRLLSNISSKESTLQLVYDVLHLTPFFKAFLVITDVLEIYMQEFWATATVHHHLGSRWITINILLIWSLSKKCCISVQDYLGLYHKRNVDFAYLMWEDFVYQVEHKDTKKSNEMYYPRFTKVIIHHFMSKDPSIPRRNKVNWYYVRDDHMFTTIKLVSRHQNMQQFSAMLPIELTNANIRNSDAYKEYYAVTTGATPPKPKASVRKTRSSSDTTVTPLTAAAGPRLSTFAKGKQLATTSKAKSDDDEDDEGYDNDDGEEGNDDDDDAQDDDDQEDEENDKDDQKEGSNDEQASDEEEFIHSSLSTDAEEETRDEESFDPILKTPKNTDDEGNGEENLGMNVGREEGQDEEDEEDELYRDVNINLGRGVQMANVYTTQEFKDSHVTLTPVNPDGQHQSSSVSSRFVTSMLNPTSDAGIESIFEPTSQMDVQTLTSVAHLPMSAPTLTPSTIATITTTLQAPTPLTTAPSTLLQDLPNFGSVFGFDHRLTTLEANFFKFMQTNQFAGAVSSIPKIVQRYIDQWINEAVKLAVKEQVKVQVSKILPKIEQTVNEQLEAEVLTQLSNSSKTSYAVAADLSETELKKILIEKMEGNKSIHRSNKQRNLYKALVEAYESDKIILDMYKDTVTLNRRRDDDVDKDEEPSAGSDRGSKRRKEGKEPESASALKDKATRSAGKSTQGSKSRQTSTSESATAEELMFTTFEMEEPLHPEFETGIDDQPIVEPSQLPEWFSQQKKPPTPNRDWNKSLMATHESIQPWISDLAKQTDSRFSFNELMDTPVDFSNFLMNRLKVNTLTPKLLAGHTYELMKGSCKSMVELEFFLEEVYKTTTDQLDWVNAKGQRYPNNLLKPLPLISNSRGHRVISFDHFINNNLKYLRGGTSSHKYTTSITKTKAADYGHIKWIEDLVPRTMWIEEPGRIIAVTELKIFEWHNYKHLDWMMVRRDDDKLYKFREGEFKRLCIQDIEDMLLLLNKDKQNRLMQIDELHKFSDGTLTDVCTALDDRLKGIRIKYQLQTIWRKSDKERAAAMM
nr:hypothetical protein [Tanacetum cinerariifolium]